MSDEQGLISLDVGHMTAINNRIKNTSNFYNKLKAKNLLVFNNFV